MLSCCSLTQGRTACFSEQFHEYTDVLQMSFPCRHSSISIWLSFIHAYSCICSVQLKKIWLFCHGLRIAVNSFSIFLSELMSKTARLPRRCLETIVYWGNTIMRYWPSVGSRWLGIGQYLFCVWTETKWILITKIAIRTRQISLIAILAEKVGSIKNLPYGLKENFFLRDQCEKFRAGKMAPSCPLG